MKLYKRRLALRAVFFALCSPGFLIGLDAHGGQFPGRVIKGYALAVVAEQNRGVLIFGFDDNDVSVFKALSNSASDAALNQFRLSKGAFVSAKLAQRLSINPGDLIMLVNPTGQNTPMGTSPLVVRYRVLGIVDSPLLPGATEAVYLPLIEAKKFSRKPTE